MPQPIGTTAEATAKRGASSPRPPLLWPMGILVALTLVFRFTDLDLIVSDSFFDGKYGFPWGQFSVPWILNDACEIFTFVLLLTTAAVMVGARWVPRLARHKLTAGFLMAAFVLGPGIVVNWGFKKNFGRPRPWEVTRYGGHWEFQKVWQPTWKYDGKAFPSGDASIGFYLGTPAFLVWRRRRRLAIKWLLVGLIGGLVVGMSRVALGAHWMTDVLWAGGFVYLAGHLTDWYFARKGWHPDVGAPATDPAG